MLDPFSAGFCHDPYPLYAELRELGPIFWIEPRQIWGVARHQDVSAVLLDWQRFCSSGGGGLTNYFKQKPWRRPSLVLEADPPNHTRFRAILARILTPRAIRQLREDFQRHADELVRRALEVGTGDAIADFAQAFPLQVVPDALGMADEDRSPLIDYGNLVTLGLGPDTEERRRILAQADGLLAWVAERCERRSLTPGRLGAAIYEASDQGEITEEEAGLLVRTFLSAGVDTTTNALSQTFNALLDHPDQWALLRDDPSLAKAAFQESLRYDASSQALFRTTTDDTQFHDIPLGRHEKVLLLLGAANRDPRRWHDADRFDITRAANGHMTFGVGIHGCVAQMVARLEAETLFTTLARSIERFEPTGPRQRRVSVSARGLTHLPVAYIPK